MDHYQMQAEFITSCDENCKCGLSKFAKICNINLEATTNSLEKIIEKSQELIYSMTRENRKKQKISENVDEIEIKENVLTTKIDLSTELKNNFNIPPLTLNQLGISEQSIKILQKYNIMNITSVYNVINTLLESFVDKEDIEGTEDVLIELLEHCVRYNKDGIKAYINLPDTNENNLLQDCILISLFKTAKWILEKEELVSKELINHTNKLGETALIIACIQKNNDIVKKLLEFEYTNVNCVNLSTQYPLSIAISLKNNEMAEMLLSNPRTNIYINGYKNISLISYSVCYSMESISIKLFNKIVEDNRHEIFFEIFENYETLLLIACRQKLSSIADMILDLYLSHKKLFTEDYINCRDNNKKTALDYCFDNLLDDISLKIIRTELVNNSVYKIFESKNKKLYGTLVNMIYNKLEIQFFELIDQYSVDLDVSHSEISILLLVSAFHKNKNFFDKMLFKFGILDGFKILDSNGNNIFCYCCENQWYDEAFIILHNFINHYNTKERKYTLFKSNNNGKSVLSFACDTGNFDIIKDILALLPDDIASNKDNLNEYYKCTKILKKNKNSKISEFINKLDITIREKIKDQDEIDRLSIEKLVIEIDNCSPKKKNKGKTNSNDKKSKVEPKESFDLTDSNSVIKTSPSQESSSDDEDELLFNSSFNRTGKKYIKPKVVVSSPNSKPETSPSSNISNPSNSTNSTNKPSTEERKLQSQKDKQKFKESKEKEKQKNKIEQQRIEAQKLEAQKLEAQRIEQQRIEQQRIEQQRIEQQRIEQQRIEQQRIEQQRIEQEKIEIQRLEQVKQMEKLEQEKMEKEKLEQHRLEQLRLEQELLDTQQLIQSQKKIDEHKLLEYNNLMFNEWRKHLEIKLQAQYEEEKNKRNIDIQQLIDWKISQILESERKFNYESNQEFRNQSEWKIYNSIESVKQIIETRQRNFEAEINFRIGLDLDSKLETIKKNIEQNIMFEMDKKIIGLDMILEQVISKNINDKLTEKLNEKINSLISNKLIDIVVEKVTEKVTESIKPQIMQNQGDIESFIKLEINRQLDIIDQQELMQQQSMYQTQSQSMHQTTDYGTGYPMSYSTSGYSTGGYSSGYMPNYQYQHNETLNQSSEFNKVAGANSLGLQVIPLAYQQGNVMYQTQNQGQYQTQSQNPKPIGKSVKK
jgi:ankyrin repeat protein